MGTSHSQGQTIRIWCTMLPTLSSLTLTNTLQTTNCGNFLKYLRINDSSETLNIIRRPEFGKNWRDDKAPYNTGLLIMIKETFLASDESVKDLSKWKTMKEPKLVQLDDLLYKWFTTVHSEGKPLTGPNWESWSLYDKMKINDKCTFSEGSNKILCVRT